jgi:hypothetical protein
MLKLQPGCFACERISFGVFAFVIEDLVRTSMFDSAPVDLVLSLDDTTVVPPVPGDTGGLANDNYIVDRTPNLITVSSEVAHGVRLVNASEGVDELLKDAGSLVES